MIGDAAAALRASRVDVEVRVHPQLLFSGVARERDRQEERRPLPLVAEAAERGAPGDPSRVEPDEVEPRTHLVRVEERACAEHVVDSRSARPTRIEEQRADSMNRIRRLESNDRQRDRGAVRAVVVERHLDGPALERPLASRSTCSNRSLPSRRSPCRPRRLRRRTRAPRTQQLRRVSSCCLPLSRPRACRPLPNGHRAAQTILLRTEDVNGARRERGRGALAEPRAHGRCLRLGPGCRLVARARDAAWPGAVVAGAADRARARLRGRRARQCGQLRALQRA